MFVKSLLLLLISISTFSFSQEECHPGEKSLINSVYQMAWDQNLNGAKFYRKNSQGIPTAISDTEFKSLVNSALSGAFSSCAYYTDGIIRWEANSDHNITLEFANISPQFGHADLETEDGTSGIFLNNTIKYTDQIDLLNSCTQYGNGYFDLYSLILHEIAHVFLGAGEYGAGTMAPSVRTYECDIAKRTLFNCDIDALRNAYNPTHNITVKNSFGAGGDIKADGFPYYNVPLAGHPFNQWRTTSFPHTLEAIDKQVPENGIQYWRRFYEWKISQSFYSSSRIISIPVIDGVFTAWFRKEYNVVFQNSFIGVGNGGNINVNYTNYNSPKTSPVLESYSIVAAPINQVISGIQYTFTQWNDGIISFYRTFYPDNHITYTANYIGKPLSSILNVDCNDIVGQPVTLTWTEHPNINVTFYQVWRKVKHNGVVGPAVLKATKTRGNTSFVDDEYEITNGYTNDLLFYDVRPFYSIENTYSDPNWLAVYGEILYKKIDSTSVKNELEISKLSVSCFPNPFNPSTNIRVIHHQSGFLEISIYSILGEKVKQLLNQVNENGIYEFVWDGTNSESVPVNSGLYIVNIKTDIEVLSEKILLLK